MNIDDKNCKPMILQGGRSEEAVYENCLKYAKILCGDEQPWSEMYNDVRRADLHNKIADDCDCDCELVTKALNEVFPVDYCVHPVDDDFLKRVDKWFDKLKEIAELPEEERFPSLLPKDFELPADLTCVPDMGLPNTAIEAEND